MTNQASGLQNNLENFSIIWLDVTINLENDATQASVNYLRDTVNFVLPFNNLDECIDYITDVKDKQIFLILSGSSAIRILPLIYQVQQLRVIYIVSSKTDEYKQYLKVHGVYSDIPSICDKLKQNLVQLSNNLVPTELMPSNLDNDKLP
jgi:hypothetical protein